MVGAPDLFWRLQRNWESDHDAEGLQASFAMVSKFDFPQGVADCVASLHHLEELPEVSGGVGVMGFCLGGSLAYLTSAVASPACCVSYYGSSVAGTLEQLDNIECPVLFHFGDADPYIPAEQVDAISDAMADRDCFTVNVEAAAGHAFDNHEADMFYERGRGGVGVGADHRLPQPPPAGRLTPPAHAATQSNRPAGLPAAGPLQAEVLPGRRHGHPAPWECARAGPAG